MTTETSVISVVHSLNKAHVLKATHRVFFHRTTNNSVETNPMFNFQRAIKNASVEGLQSGMIQELISFANSSEVRIILPSVIMTFLLLTCMFLRQYLLTL